MLMQLFKYAFPIKGIDHPQLQQVLIVSVQYPPYTTVLSLRINVIRICHSYKVTQHDYYKKKTPETELQVEAGTDEIAKLSHLLAADKGRVVRFYVISNI